MKKHIITLLLALFLICMVTPAASAAELIAFGRCGENLYWNLDSEGTLTISGKGAMSNYDSVPSQGVWNTPWYNYKSRITAIVVEDGVTHIGREAFHYYYSNVTKVVLPDTLESIGDQAFYHCTALAEITFPDSLTHIGELAFAHCESLREIALPDGIAAVEYCAFYSCDSLRSISLPGSLDVLGMCAFLDCNALQSVVIPEGIRELEDCALASCDQLESVFLPESVETLGEYLFSYCQNLKTITIPAGVRSIEFGAFDHCERLEQVIFEGDAPELGENLFLETTADVYYPADNPTWTADILHNYGGSITWIPYSPETQIASGWSGATEWTLTAGGVLTFRGEGNMRNYDYTESRPWDAYANRIRHLVIEPGVRAVGECAFKGLSGLERVTLPDSGLARIGEAAFYGCTGLKQIHIPDSIYTVFDYTFKNCTALEKVRLPAQLIKIGQGAFENCTLLPCIFIPGETEIIGSWSFKGCTGLTEVDMTWANAETVREGAFKNCASLTTILLPSGIQVLGDSCFYGIGASSFTVPETVTTIEPWCFARAYSLNTITFRGDAPAIGEGAFNKISLTAWYPGSNPTWSPAILRSYGGAVAWLAN